MDFPSLSSLFGLTLHPAEIVVRGTATYWFIFLLFRCVLRRDVGSLAITDILLLVMIADAAQNAMAGSYTTITEGIILISTIGGWNYLLDLLAYRFEPLRRLIEGRPLPLVVDGRLMRRNMRHELISRDELMAALRENGVEDIADVKLAVMETDGSFSVIRRDGDAGGPHRRKSLAH